MLVRLSTLFSHPVYIHVHVAVHLAHSLHVLCLCVTGPLTSHLYSHPFMYCTMVLCHLYLFIPYLYVHSYILLRFCVTYLLIPYSYIYIHILSLWFFVLPSRSSPTRIYSHSFILLIPYSYNIHIHSSCSSPTHIYSHSFILLIPYSYNIHIHSYILLWFCVTFLNAHPLLVYIHICSCMYYDTVI